MSNSYYEDLSVGQIHDRAQIIGLSAYWRDVRMEYVANNLVYSGKNSHHNVPTSDTTWEIWKYTWDGEDLVRIEGPLPGAWDNRATLDWA